MLRRDKGCSPLPSPRGRGGNKKKSKHTRAGWAVLENILRGLFKKVQKLERERCEWVEGRIGKGKESGVKGNSQPEKKGPDGLGIARLLLRPARSYLAESAAYISIVVYYTSSIV